MTAFRQQMQAFIDANLSPSARSGLLADAARKMRADLVASGRAINNSVTFVDGTRDANENDVRGTGGGTILYRFNYMQQASSWTLAFLQAWAPVRSGLFRASFYLGVNGKFVTAEQFNPASVPYDAIVVIGNTQPYSRKIDIQIEGTKQLHYSVPAGMFAAAARAVQRQFSGTVKASRAGTYTFPGQYILRGGNRAGKIVNSPAVVIVPIL